MQYTIQHAAQSFKPSLDWDSLMWRHVPTLTIDQFHHRSSPDHRPLTEAKLLLAERTLHVLFRAHDRYVKSVAEQYNDSVCRDSCVELFIQPAGAGTRYFNFEFSCGGVMLLYCVNALGRVGNQFDLEPVRKSDADKVKILTTLPKLNPTEITDAIEWRLTAAIPLAVMEAYVGPIPANAGDAWRGNLQKCADLTSHPHWAAWSNIGDELNFHQPKKFGELMIG